MGKKNWAFSGPVGRYFQNVREVMVINAKQSQYRGVGITELAALFTDAGDNDNRWSVRIVGDVDEVAKVIDEAEFDYESSLKFMTELKWLESDEKYHYCEDYIGLQLEAVDSTARVFGDGHPGEAKGDS